MKVSEMINDLQKLQKEFGDKEIFVGDLDEDGEIVGLVPAVPQMTEGGAIFIEALAPLGENKEEKLIEEKVSEIVDWCASGQGGRSGAGYFRKEIEELVKNLGQYQKTQIWKGLVEWIEGSEGWTIDDMRVLAEILRVKKIQIEL